MKLFGFIVGIVTISVCPEPNNFCIIGTPDNSSNILFTIHASSKGWASVGVGESMSNSVLFVGWKNGASYIVSDRKSTGYSTPSTIPQTSEIIPLQVTAPSWANIAFSIKRAVKFGDATISKTSKFIYAYSDSTPQNIASVTSGFSIHSSKGLVGQVDFLSANASNPEPTTSNNGPILKLPALFTYESLVMAHGYVLITAWIVCPFIGIYIARFMKDRLGHWWFYLHTAIMLVGAGIGSICGILLIFLYKSGKHFSAEKNIHPLLGIIVTGGMIIQIILGFVSDKLFDTSRTTVPWWDKLHWWLGRSLVIAALVNVYFGIRLYQEFNPNMGLAMPIVAGACLLLGIASLIFGQVTIGQVSIYIINVDHTKKDNKDDEKNERSSYFNRN